nr:hypothetical protein GCM10025732_27250 [Glycomyces mayteni]
MDLGELPAHYEVEVALVVADALKGLPLPKVRMHVNNRKLSQGFYQGLGIRDTEEALRIIDKLDKIGRDATAKLLIDGVDATPEQAEACLKLASISAEDSSFVDEIRALGVADPLLEEGLTELAAVVDAAAAAAPGFVVADMKIARGLDYYTGTVYEVFIEGEEHLGSVCSGGRYDKLASDGKNTYPGVGLSIGVSRLLVPLLQAGKLDATREVPTCVLVALNHEDDRPASNAIAQRLRARGIPVQVSPSAAKFGKQIKFADKRGIPFVLFTNDEGTQIKDIRSGDQATVDLDTWNPRPRTSTRGSPPPKTSRSGRPEGRPLSCFPQTDSSPWASSDSSFQSSQPWSRAAYACLSIGWKPRPHRTRSGGCSRSTSLSIARAEAAGSPAGWPLTAWASFSRSGTYAGCAAAMWPLSSGSGFLPFRVANPPGSTMVTLIPNDATSPASASFRPSRAHFDAWYAPPSGIAMRPAADESCTMWPEPCARRWGRTAWTTHTAP